MRKDQTTGFVQPGEEVKGGVNLTADFSYLMGGYNREDRQTLFRHVQQKDERQQT